MFSTLISPRFGDVDGLQHVNNVSVIEWFETGRTEFFRIFNPGLELQKWNLIMVHMEVDYLEQIFFGEMVEVRSFVTRIGNSSFTLRQQIWQNGLLCSQGDFVMVHFDFMEQKPQPLTEQQRLDLDKHLQEV